MSNNVLDGSVAVAATTAPFWIEQLNTYLGVVVLIGGAILLAMRLILTYRELKRKRSE